MMVYHRHLLWLPGTEQKENKDSEKREEKREKIDAKALVKVG